MSKYLYQVRTALMWEMCVMIDVDFKGPDGNTTANYIKEMVDFWTSSKDRLRDSKGDYPTAFAKMLAEEVYRVITYYSYTLEGVITHLKEEEGWYPVDGTHGITIVSADGSDIDYDYFDVNEIKPVEEVKP